MRDRNNFDDAEWSYECERLFVFRFFQAASVYLINGLRKERALRDLKIRKLQNESSCSRKRLRQYIIANSRTWSCDLVEKTTRNFSFVEKFIRKEIWKILNFHAKMQDSSFRVAIKRNKINLREKYLKI